MTSVTPERLREFRELRAEKDRTKKAADEAKKSFDVAQHELFQDMQAEGYDSTKIDGVQYVRKATIYGQVQDIDAFRTWAHEDPDRAGDYLKEAVEAGRINEMVRASLDNGEELPPGIGFYAREYVSVTETK